MDKKFVDKIISSGKYDTRQYRYISVIDRGELLIKRIGIDVLDRTAALSDRSDQNPFGWVTVWRDSENA